MAHIYLCNPQSQVRTFTQAETNTYLDDVVQPRARRIESSPYVAAAAFAPSVRAGPRGGSVPRTVQSVHSTPDQQLWGSRDRAGEVGHATTCTHEHRSPSAAAAAAATPPPPPSYDAVHYDNDGGESSLPRDSDVQQLIKLLRQQAASRTASPPAIDPVKRALQYDVTEAKPVAVKKKRTRLRQVPPAPAAIVAGPVNVAAAPPGENTSAASAVAFAQNFLLEYEGLSRRDIIIDYYATFPSAPTLRQPNAPSRAASPLPQEVRAVESPAREAARQPRQQRRQAARSKEATRAPSWRRCRVVFPGSLWAAVLQHHRQLLQLAVVRDAESALPRTTVDVSSLHCSATELEAILSVQAGADFLDDAAAVLNACAFNGVWEVYHFVSSVTNSAGSRQGPPRSRFAGAAPPVPQPPVRFLPRSAALREEHSWADEEEMDVPTGLSDAAPRSSSRIGGAPWRQARRHISNQRGDAMAAQKELVVPVQFATPVTNKLRRAARSGANSDLHIALRRDGLYAVPSAQEVRVRATRVNAEGLFVELVFRWPQGEEAEEHAEEAMDEAPFADTWTFLEDCQPPTATSVAQKVVKREAIAEPPVVVVEPLVQQPQPQPERFAVQATAPAPAPAPALAPAPAPAPLPLPPPVRRVNAGTLARTETPPRAARPHKPVKVRSVMCEVPLTSPEWRAVAARHPNALRAALEADVAHLAREALSAAQVSIGIPRASKTGSLSISFELDAVPEKVVHRVKAASFPESFPHLASLYPAASPTALPARQRVSMGTSVPSFAEAARAVSNGGSAKGSTKTSTTVVVPPLTQATLRSPMSVSDSTVSEVFSASDEMPVARATVTAATQTSATTSLRSSTLRSAPESAQLHPQDDAMDSEEPAEGTATDGQEEGEGKEAAAAPELSHLSVLYAEEECEARRSVASRSPRTGSECTPVKSPRGHAAESPSRGSESATSVPVAVAMAALRPYMQGSRASDVSLVSLQITEVVAGTGPAPATPGAATPRAATPKAETPGAAAPPQEPKGTRLSFSMQGEKWETLLEECPVLLKRALRSDVQELFGVPADALGEPDLSFDDRLHVVVRVGPGVALKPSSEVASAMQPTNGDDVNLPVQRMPHLWDLYDQQMKQHLEPPHAALGSKMTSAYSSTRKPREADIVRRQVTDGRTVLKGFLKEVHVAPLESLPSPSAAAAAAMTPRTAGGVVSTYQVQLPGTMWNSILAQQRELVAVACVDDVAALLDDQLAKAAVGAMTVLDDGRLSVELRVPLSALPCDLNPPQFRWALGKLPLTNLHDLHERATSRVPTTLQLRRFFDAPELSEAVLRREEGAIRTLFVAETCALLDIADENILRLALTQSLTVDVVLRVPLRVEAAAWQQELMTYAYPALTEFLSDLAAPPHEQHDMQRRPTLLSSSSLMMSASSVRSSGSDRSVASQRPREPSEEKRASLVEEQAPGPAAPAEDELHSYPVLRAEEEEAAHDVSSQTEEDSAVEELPQLIAVEEEEPRVEEPVSEEESSIDYTDYSSSAHAVRVEGPLWPRVLEEHAEELCGAVLADAASVLSPLSVKVEKLTPSLLQHKNAEGIVFTFLLLSPPSAVLREVEAALQGCLFTEAQNLYARTAEALESAAMNAATSTAYALQLDGEAWLEVMEHHRKEMADTFALEALDCLRDNDAVTVPVGVTVTEVVPKKTGVLLCYRVVSGVVVDAVERFRVAEVVEQYAFPLLWELYDRAMLSREPFKQNSNPHWIAARRQRLLSTAYDAPDEPYTPRSYSFVGYSNQADLETYLQHAFGDATEGSPAADAAEEKAAAAKPPVVSEAGHAEYDRRHLPAPFHPSPVKEKRSPPLSRLFAREVCPPRPAAVAPVARPLNLAEAPLSLGGTPTRPAVLPQQPPPLPMPDMKAVVPATPPPPPQLQRNATPSSASKSSISNHQQVRKTTEKKKSEKKKMRVQPPPRQPTPETVEAEESTSDDDAADTDESDVEKPQVDKGLGQRVHSPLRTMGPIMVRGTVSVAPVRPPDVTPAATPPRAQAVTRIPIAAPVVIPRRVPAPPSRPHAEAPALTSARQIDAPVRMRARRTRGANTTPLHPSVAPVPEVALQSRPTRGVHQHQQHQQQWTSAPPPGVPLPLLGSRTATFRGRSDSKKVSRPARQPSSLAMLHTPVSNPAPALRLPGMNRHSTAPITVVDVRMTHPPLSRPPVVPAAADLAPSPSAGVPLTNTPQLSRAGMAPAVVQSEESPSQFAESPAPLLPVLHASSTASAPPSAGQQGKKAPATPAVVQPPDAAQRSAPRTRDGRDGAAKASRRVSPPVFSRPTATAGISLSAPSLAPPRQAGAAKATAVELPEADIDATPPRRTASFFSSPSSHSLSPPSVSAVPVMQPLATPQLTGWRPTPQRTPPTRKASVYSDRGAQSNGPTVSHRSRASRSASPAPSSLPGSMETPPRSVAGETGSDHTPQLSLPRLRSDQASVVAVTTRPNDRFQALWQKVSSVEDSLRTRYPRMERELMAAANASSQTTGPFPQR